MRILEGGLKVYSFFSYDSISQVIFTKHHFWGHRILKEIASHTFGEFAKRFEFSEKVAALGVDDRVVDGYSHTAILANALSSASITPIYGALRAENSVKYSGQSYEFRRKNPRRFIISPKVKDYKYAILADDVVTSGLTLREAKESLACLGVDTLFALVLADAKDN
ncbi:MAG: ComF family protein [Campylobacteraceae bacterium]|nr:ComF family protein [Campylobacteraceae bacterium]